MEEQDGEWTTDHRFWSCGHDSSCPDIREVRMIEDCAKALEGEAEVFHSTFEDFQQSVVESASDDDEQTLSLTMLRCFPLRICITNLEMTDYSSQDNGSQCLGTHTFKYAFMPYSGSVESAGVWQTAERFNHSVRVAQIGPSADGKLPLAHSFLTVENQAIHVSAVKQSEDGEAWIVRLFNPTDGPLSGRISLNGGMAPPAPQSPVERQAAGFALPADTGRKLSKTRLVDLEENQIEELRLDADGAVNLEVTKKKIVTLEFLP